MRNINVLDLFAGAGGFSLGFSEAGFNVVSAIEVDKWASETLSLNHPDTQVINEDITKLSDDYIATNFNDINVIIGGPPCQGFSIANKNGGDPKDPRNSLFIEFIRFVKLISPDVVIMENVPNLLKTKNSSGDLVIDIILNEFKKYDYNVKYKVLNAAEYGVPQIRNRLFIIASRISSDNPFPSPTHVPLNVEHDLINSHLPDSPTTWDAISDLPQIEAREGSDTMDYISDATNDYQIMMRVNSYKIYNHIAMKHTKRLVERFKHMPVGVNYNDIPIDLQPKKRGNPNEQGTFYSQNNRRMSPDKQCHTITASFYSNFIHPFLHRNFTPREGARIQSFPDWYKFEGKPTVVSNNLLKKEERHSENYLCQYNQIGNAVPPLLAKVIANKIKEEFF